MISDSYDLIDIDGVAYEADCRMVTVGGESFGALPTTPPRALILARPRLTMSQTLVRTRLLRRPRKAPKTTRSRSSTSSTLSASTRLVSTRRVI
jgi:hypothetical protein